VATGACSWTQGRVPLAVWPTACTARRRASGPTVILRQACCALWPCAISTSTARFVLPRPQGTGRPGRERP